MKLINKKSIFSLRNSFAHKPAIVASCVFGIALAQLLLPSLTMAAKDNKILDNDIILTESPIGDTGRDVWRTRISASTNENLKSKNELQNLIDQINSIEFNGMEFDHSDMTQQDGKLELETTKKSSPVETAVIAEAQAIVKKDSETAPNPKSDTKISNKTLELFKKMTETPQEMENPIELAEILFQSKCYMQAAKCYEEYLRRFENINDEDKAWAMFQIGNCLEKSQPKEALQSYSQLINNHPNVIFSEIAKVKIKLINWQITNKPKELVESPQL